MKKKSNISIFVCYVMLFFLEFQGSFACAQCIATTKFPASNYTIPASCTPYTITASNYAGEYNEGATPAASTTYVFTSSVATDWLTITDGSNNVIQFGNTPQTITTSSTPPAQLRCHVHTNSGCGTQNSNRTTKITCTSCSGPGAPACPTLTSPANGATSIVLLPTLTWGVATNAVSYNVYLDADAGCSNTPLTLLANVSTTSYTLTMALSENTKYRWMIVPIDCAGNAPSDCLPKAFCFTTIAQTTWTGNTDTDWNTVGNWTGGIPDGTLGVILPDVTNDPVISMTGALANTITIQSGAILHINAGGSLTLNGSTVQAILNQGTIDNNGSITIGSTASVGLYGIRNYGIVNNNTGGTIILDRSTSAALQTESGSTFTNTATITIGSGFSVGLYGIRNYATINSNTNGLINIDRSTSAAIRTESGSIFTNASTITIGAIASVGTYGIYNQATFSNNFGSIININRTTTYGMYNFSGIFTNASTITIGANFSVGTYGIFNFATFNNNSGSIINIDRTTTYGIYNSSGTFTNLSAITIGAIASVGNYGIRNNGNFNNNTGGLIKIDRSTAVALYITAGTFTNTATITIGALASVGSDGIQNFGIFINNSGGQINTDNSSFLGIASEAGSSFTNAASITIGANSSTGSYGIYSIGIFNNNAGGLIKIDRTTSAAVYVTAGTFTNAATITLGGIASVGVRGIQNYASFNNTGGQINIDNSTFLGIASEAGSTFTNAATITIGATTSVGQYGIYSIGIFNNNAGGLITIDRSTTVAVYVTAGTFTNAATITLGAIASVGPRGIQNYAIFNNTGGQINIDNSTFTGITSEAGSTFTNAATITIGATTSVGQYGIYSIGTFNNNAGGLITIDRSTSIALYITSGTFTNAATITIGAIASVGTVGINNYNYATFNNNAGGLINIDRSTSVAVYISSGTFTNAATITIGGIASVGSNGIQNYSNYSTFINNTGGQITIDRSTSAAIRNETGSTFTNAATITIGANASVGSYGIENYGTFFNSTGGQINIDRSTMDAIENGSTFTNAATITIGGIASVGSTGIINNGTFNNNAGGLINIDNSTDGGILSNGGSTFTNAATITIGAIASVGVFGIYNYYYATFNNNAGGQINIDRSTDTGIRNETGSTFANAATITIGATASVGLYGIWNDATFNNNTSGQINIDRSTYAAIQTQSGSTFTNAATITMGALDPIPWLITTAGTFINSVNGVLKGTGNIQSANFTNAGGTLSPGYSPGLMSFTSSEDFSNSIMLMEVNGTGLAGTDYDQIVVAGTATLGGTLTVTQAYSPAPGDIVTILSATSISGTFSTVNLPAGWVINYYPTAVKLSFGPLPVELVSFTAEKVRENEPGLHDVVLLKWVTESEYNNAGFEIQRSIQGIDWQILNFVKGNGTTQERHDYTYLDASPNNGLNYYRLLQKDFDGENTFSKVVSVEIKSNQKDMLLFPNPTKDLVQIYFDQEVIGELELIDWAGRILIEQAIIHKNQHTMNIRDLPNGIYFLRFENQIQMVVKK